MMANLELLQWLCGAQGVSGDEESIRRLILDEIEPYADNVEVTPLGNIIAFKMGKQRPKTKLMLSAHMDEVGFIITHITEDGLLKFAEVGGLDQRVLCGKSVLVNRKYPGVIGAKPIHLMESDEREKSVPAKDLYIDIGAKDRAEAEQAVRPGDTACFVSGFDTAYGMVKSKALDDRAGCVILIDLLRKELEYDMTFVFAVQEEVGLRGAKTAAYTVRPDAAIVVETTTAADIAGVEPERQVCRVGQGPVVSFMDRSTIYDREYYRLAFETAEKLGIKCQAKEAVAGGNDAGAIHVTRGGIRTLAVSLACRYLHSAAGLIAQEDFHAAEKLVFALANQIAGMEPQG